LTILLAAAAYTYAPQLKPTVTNIIAPPKNLTEIRTHIVPKLTAELAAQNLTLGAPTFLRIFKEERQLEVWLQQNQTYQLFKTYPICNHSGDLGPKLKEGDHQSPEGFYTVSKSAMNPNSSYHLSFNLGFPNAYDQSHNRTGSFLMIHGDCVSVGCYAMTDAGIEEIYLLVEAAQNAGQESVPVHAFPFKMTEPRLAAEAANKWHPYWSNLKTGYDQFEQTKIPPKISVANQTYTFN